jgi:hypothetical protein
MSELLQPTPSQIHEAIKQTEQWIEDWHQKLRDSYGLTDLVLLGEEGDIGMSGGNGFLLGQDDLSYFWNVTHEVGSNFGKVSVLQFDQISNNPKHPLITRVLYRPRRFNHLIAVTLGWRFDSSEVLYEGLQKPSDLVLEINKVTRPGILFSCPDELAESRNHTQALKLRFVDGPEYLDGWDAYLSYERLQSESVNCRAGLFNYRDGQLISSYPEVFNPIPHLESFARHQAKLPLIET